jgi:hypothetical protein
MTHQIRLFDEPIIAKCTSVQDKPPGMSIRKEDAIMNSMLQPPAQAGRFDERSRQQQELLVALVLFGAALALDVVALAATSPVDWTAIASMPMYVT